MKMNDLPTPVYIIDEGQLELNLKILNNVEKLSGCKILLAQKAFSAFSEYPLVAQYISGTTSSGLYEAKLSHEEMHKENHVFAPAYKDSEIEELDEICDHIVFNSFSQLLRHAPHITKASIGIRINPEFSTQEHAIYDPCSPYSRMGVTRDNFPDKLPACVEGFHIHTLCEQDFEALSDTFDAAETKFGEYFKRMKWINLGGGHHITRPGYNTEGLVELVKYIRHKYGAEVYLEPGEAIALNAGYLMTEVMDIVHNGMDILIVDASAECHMPDVLEMPYRPPLNSSGKANEKQYTYRIASRTCLAGDVIGDYSFDSEIKTGDKLVFEDMAIYTMVKNNTFNGMPLPAIARMNADGECTVVKEFGYSDFKGRLS